MDERLDAYRYKRNFNISGEPAGHPSGSSEPLCFVVQHHLARRAHYDLRLEWGGVLLSWAVPKGPSENPQDKRLAVQVEDHPLEYKDFEGQIPKGEYGGGTVMLWDEGSWEPLLDVDEGLEKGSLKFALKGRRLKGKWALVRMKAEGSGDKKNWLLIKEKDAAARTESRLAEFNISVRSGRTMDEIETDQDAKQVKNPFNITEVQLPKLITKPPEGEDWVFELKYDGYRIMAYIEDNRVRLLTRNQQDYSQRFASVAASLLDWAGNRAMVLDGEMVVTDAMGVTDFQNLQNYLKHPESTNLTFIVFDILALDSNDLRGLPLIQRKAALSDLMQGAPKNLHYSRHVQGRGQDSFTRACELGLEGVIGKRAASLYSGGRNGDWVKLKCDRRQEFVIGGFTLSAKKARGISSLLLGVYDGDDLLYTGRAGTGLSSSDIQELKMEFAGLESGKPPFSSPPTARADEAITWLKPELVGEIKFSEWTQDGLLRQASFKGLRLDKSPKEVKRKHPGRTPEPAAQIKTDSSSEMVVAGVKITSPEKMLFAEAQITKADIIRYYAQVAAKMLPYVSQRILTTVRCPKGILAPCFFRKHPGPGSQNIVTIDVLKDDGSTEAYYYIENVSGLIAEAQLGALEFHIWGSRIDELERPDIMVFDLDPDEGLGLDSVCQGVEDLRAILTELGLQAYLKTSGGKGYHVVVPLKPAAYWGDCSNFAKGVAQVMEKKWPNRYTGNMRKAKRGSKVFIDWMRNGRGATSIAPYSIRARSGAPVSMPITWEELGLIAPDGIDMRTALLRINDVDPWEGFYTTGQLLRN